MQSWKVPLATLLIFGAGVATGFFLFHRAVPKSPDKTQPTEPAAAKQAIQIFRPSISRLTADLGLSTDQVEKIRTIYHESRERMKAHVGQARKAAQASLNQNLQSEQDLLNTAIAAVLDEKQFVKYRKLPGMSFSQTLERPSPSELPDPLKNSNATLPPPQNANATSNNQTN